MRALVTGGAGFIGSAVADRLLAHGYDVYVIDDLSTGTLTNLGEARREGRVKFHRFDIRSEGVREMFMQTRPEVVLHLAAQGSVPTSVSDPIRDAQINAIGLLRVLDACVAAGTRKIVFASSGGTIYGPQDSFPIPETATGRPASPYGITKRTGEDYLRFFRAEHGLEFTSLALANVYGPRQDPQGEAGVVAIFASKLIAGQPPTIYGTGDDTRDYVYVSDVAHAFVKACDAGSGETINIGTARETSVNELFKLMAEAAGYAGEASYGPPRPGDLPRNALDPSKAAKILDWRPWTSLSDGLRETVAWFRRRAPSG